MTKACRTLTADTYIVSTLTETDGRIATAEIGRFTDIDKAISTAKSTARNHKDAVRYGPDSLAYVGREVTAVVSW